MGNILEQSFTPHQDQMWIHIISSIFVTHECFERAPKIDSLYNQVVIVVAVRYEKHTMGFLTTGGTYKLWLLGLLNTFFVRIGLL